MAVQNNKKRILCLMEILLHQTDEDHILNASDLAEILKNKYGIEADRRTIYTEVAVLQDFGLDVVQVRGKTKGYYIGSRDFEFAEVKLLVDTVQSSKFITEKKSRELIGKLEQLCSESQAKQLNPQVVVTNRPKTENETIYYNVDRIHTAISGNRQISFQYLDWNMRKELVPRVNSLRKVSPWALIWQDENYYLAAYDSGDGHMKHYRVDKMGKVEVCREAREGVDQFAKVDLAAYTNQIFGMYGGEEQMVTLQFPNRLVGVVLDRFGREADIRQMPEGELRQIVGMVPKKAVLFKGTIRSNLQWGKPDATEDEMWQAIDTAQAREVVEGKRDGLDAEIAQNGKNLSGGQRQRLTIARALVRSPRILILDDSASALDYATDAKLRTAIRNLEGGITTFIVSQRASSILYADKIVVLDDGEMAGIGTHDELLQNCEVYREIYFSQYPEERLKAAGAESPGSDQTVGDGVRSEKAEDGGERHGIR